MSAKRVTSGRTGRTGWRFRFRDPVTGSRTHRTFWVSEKRAEGFTVYFEERAPGGAMLDVMVKRRPFQLRELPTDGPDFESLPKPGSESE